MECRAEATLSMNLHYYIFFCGIFYIQNSSFKIKLSLYFCTKQYVKYGGSHEYIFSENKYYF